MCKQPYYNESNIALLERSLPAAKRKTIVLEALIKEFEKIPDAKLPGLLGRLIASNEAYKKMVTSTPQGGLLPKAYLAVLLFYRDARMKEGVVAPFSNAEVWKR